MAQANEFLKGEEKKFAFNIEAAGFDMSTDDFELEVTSQNDRVSVMKSGEPNEKGIWANEDGTLVVFSETEEVTVPAAEEGGEPTVENKTTWYAILDTKDFTGNGRLTVTCTAYITDQKAYDGVRKSIDQAVLGTLKNR